MDIDIKGNRFDQLKQMHHIILNINNEDMCDDWMLLVGNESNLKHIAESDGYYDECSILFADLVTDAGYWY